MANSTFIWPGLFANSGSSVTFSVPALFPDGSQSAPSISFSSSTNSGWYWDNSSSQVRATTGGTDRIAVLNNGIKFLSTGQMYWSSTGALSGSTDTIISRSAAGVITVGGSSNPVTINGTFGASASVPVVIGPYETTGNTGAVTNAINYTPASVSGTYRIDGVVNVTAWVTPATFTVAATYKDASGNARTDTALVIRGSTGASAAAVTAVDRWYFSFPAIDIDATGTAITLSTTGTFTGSPAYNLAAYLSKVR